MISGSYIALSGAKLQELRLEIVANNLANANTAGYKADRLTSRSFDFLLHNTIDESAIQPPLTSAEETAYDIAYTQTSLFGTNFSQGSLQHTGNPLNVALQGPGFIAIDTPYGVRYTRQGNFELDSKGALVTPDGHTVRGKGLSNLSSGTVTIDDQGTVYLDNQSQGSLEIVEFENSADLRKEGHTLFTAAEGAQTKRPDATTVSQGYLEMPNINTLTEMVNLIDLNQLFQSYQKAITSIDECTDRLLSSLGVM